MDRLTFSGSTNKQILSVSVAKALQWQIVVEFFQRAFKTLAHSHTNTARQCRFVDPRRGITLHGENSSRQKKKKKLST